METRTRLGCVGRWVARALAALATGGVAVGQTCEPGWTEGFPNAPGFNGEARAVAIFNDGGGPKVYAGGHFGVAGGQVASGIARWEGDHWAAVGGGVWPVNVGGNSGNGVYWLGVLDDGSGPALYAAGNFYQAGGMPAMSVARWDGQEWSALGAGLNYTVRAMTVYDDGHGPAIYAVGLFTQSGQTPLRGLAKWDGTAWTDVGGGLSQGQGYGYSIGVFDLGDGPKLYVGGVFKLLHGHAGTFLNNIAAWDGDRWSGLGEGVSIGSAAPVMKMVLFDHGSGPQLTIGGSLSVSPTEPGRARVLRWTGSQWVQVGSDLSANSGHYVNSFAVVPGPSGPVLHVGGWFAGATWLNQVNYVARLVGGDWKSIDGGMAGNQPSASQVRSLIVAEGAGGPEIWASGAFKIAGDAIAHRVALWDGQRWRGLEHGRGLTGEGINPPWLTRGITACRYNDGSGEKVFVGGQFVGAGDRVCNNIAAWDGAEWHQVGDGVRSSSGSAQVNALAAFDDGSGNALYATGKFDSAGGGPCFSVARWDGAHWSAPGGNGITLNGIMAGTGNALAVYDHGSGPALHVGGSFEHAGTATAGSIARWNGSVWSGLGNGSAVLPSDTIDALEVFDEGSGPRLFVGGGFASIAGVPALAIARWDGSTWSPVGGGFPPATPTTGAVVSDLAVLDDGSGPALFAGGRYGWVGLQGALLMAKWDGAAWQPLTTSVGIVPLAGVAARIWSFDDGSGPAIYVGGSPLLVSGHNPPVGLLRLRGGVWELPGGGVAFPQVPANTSVVGAAVRHERDRDVLLVTGLFGEVGGAPSMGVAEWRGCPICYGDCDRDGTLSAADFGCFQTKFVAGESWADCNGSGALTAADFGCFQTKFVQGCP